MLHLSEKRKGEKRRIHKKQAIAWIFPSTSKQPIPLKKQRSRTLVLRFGECLELFQAAKITRWPLFLFNERKDPGPNIGRMAGSASAVEVGDDRRRVRVYPRREAPLSMA
jgi:hypothetical protein